MNDPVINYFVSTGIVLDSSRLHNLQTATSIDNKGIQQLGYLLINYLALGMHI